MLPTVSRTVMMQWRERGANLKVACYTLLPEEIPPNYLRPPCDCCCQADIKLRKCKQNTAENTHIKSWAILQCLHDELRWIAKWFCLQELQYHGLLYGRRLGPFCRPGSTCDHTMISGATLFYYELLLCSFVCQSVYHSLASRWLNVRSRKQRRIV